MELGVGEEIYLYWYVDLNYTFENYTHVRNIYVYEKHIVYRACINFLNLYFFSSTLTFWFSRTQSIGIQNLSHSLFDPVLYVEHTQNNGANPAAEDISKHFCAWSLHPAYLKIYVPSSKKQRNSVCVFHILLTLTES